MPRQGSTDLSRIPKRSELQFTDRFNRASLQRFRNQGDVLADRVVAALHASNGLTNIYDLLGLVRERADLARGDPGDAFVAFIDHSESMPDWVDWQLVEKGQRVQATYSTVMAPSLFAGSLVGGSMFRSAALVTAMAGNLVYDPTKRVSETAMIISHLAIPNQLKPGGKARETLTRIRLLHAGLRHWLPSSGRYKRTDEVPINQHDLAITLSLFGYLNVRSLALMAVHLNREEIDAYMHMWRFAGFILGIYEELLPESLEMQEEFFLASCIDEAKPEQIPRATKYVLDAFAKEAHKNSWGIIPYHVAQTQLHQLTRYLSGNEFCSGMEIEDLGSNHWSILLTRGLGRATSFTAHYVPFGEAALRHANLYLVQKMIDEHEAKQGKLGRGINEAPDGTKITNEELGKLQAKVGHNTARL